MAQNNSKGRTFFILAIFIALAAFGSANEVFAASNTTGYVWSNQIGWINFGCTNCSAEVSAATMTGWAWSQNYGWIKLNPTNSGIVNNGSGVLSGSAWGEKVGWIDFSGVTINGSGQFTGNASGTIVGTLNFSCANCNVVTTWTPSVVVPPGGGGGHTECNFTTQKCEMIGSPGTNQCSTDNDCICDSHGDFNKDGKVNITDFSIMMYFWKHINPSNICVDLNHDTIVDIKDFSIMLYWWTK